MEAVGTMDSGCQSGFGSVEPEDSGEWSDGVMECWGGTTGTKRTKDQGPRTKDMGKAESDESDCRCARASGTTGTSGTSGTSGATGTLRDTGDTRDTGDRRQTRGRASAGVALLRPVRFAGRSRTNGKGEGAGTEAVGCCDASDPYNRHNGGNTHKGPNFSFAGTGLGWRSVLRSVTSSRK